MKRTVLALLFAVALLTQPCFAQEPAPEHAPKIACNEPTFNFGDVDNSQDVEHTFVVKNEGDLTLEIARARPSCGCTIASLSQNSVPPGDEAKIATKLSLRGRQGQQHKTITVESNDPKQPSFTLVLEGNALAEMQVRPNQVFFGRIATESCVTSVVEVAIQGTNPVTVTKSSCDVPFLTVDVQKKADSSTYAFTVATKPPLPRGTLRGNVHIETDSPKYPAMDIAVSAFVVGDISFAPEEIALVEDPKQIVTRYVIARSESGHAFEITSVETPVPTMATSIVAMDANNAGYRVEIRNIVPTKDLDGKVLHIHTNLETAPDLAIPFRVISAQPNVSATVTPEPAPKPVAAP